jgi:hypothetical protein
VDRADGSREPELGAAGVAPNMPGATCTTTVRATNLEGVTTEIAARYHLVAPGG